MKNLSLLIIASFFTSCQISENSKVELGKLGTPPVASTICTGTTIAGVAGTANCSGGGGGGSSVSVTEGFYVFAPRADVATLNFDDLVDDLWAGVNPVATRAVATLKDAQDGTTFYENNYSVIPRPLYDSDGRYAMNDYNGNPISPAIPEKRHYLETIALSKTGISRGAIDVCGTTNGTIDARIADCRQKNGAWSFYSGAQYGQSGEGDWSLVTVVDDGGTLYEVWRDERTKLLWSDKAASDYYWYRAAGYSKATADSIAETEFSSQPGVQVTTPVDPVNDWGWSVEQATMQPAVVDGGPISVCPDVVGGEIAAGGGTYNTYAPNPETKFKGNLSIANNVIWKLPSIDDYKLADVNGIRKVLPNMDYGFWSSSSGSDYRGNAWYFYGDNGGMEAGNRIGANSVRCVAPSRD